MLTKDNLNEALADAVMDRPREFFIGKKRFCLYSPSLGVSLMLSRHLATLSLDEQMLNVNPSLECLRLVSQHKPTVCYILAILSYRRYRDLCESQKLKRLAEYYGSKLSDEEIAQLFLLVMNEHKAESFIELSGLREEQEEQVKIAKLKNKDGHTLTFGGKTIYGALIDNACKAYGWSKEYVVWGIDLVSLKMILADSITSLYLSDKEAEELHTGRGKDEIFGMNAEDFEKLKASVKY